MIGRSLSHYKIVAEISRGGMGIVYRALDLKLDREVALKVLPPELVSDESRKRRFIQEAKAAAALKHPHIAVIYEIDDTGGTTFIAMELIEGKKLSEILSQERLSVARCLELAVEIGEGISHAHERGIVHRDLKPSNVMVGDDGHAKLIDFGLVKLVEPLGAEDTDAETRQRYRTQAGEILGTTAYMSPEQARGRSVDHRTDIFSFGIVLYEMLAGELPFEGPSGPETLTAIINAPAPRLVCSVKGPAVLELERIVHRCLAKDPEDRYQTAKDLLSEIRHVKRESESGVGSGPAAALPARAGVGRGAGAVVVLALALGVSAYLLVSRDGRVSRIQLANPAQVTSGLGVEDYPTWSPDGRSLAYAASPIGSLSGEGEDWDIWVTQLGRGQPLNRTSDYTGRDEFPAWSPDGSEIAFRSTRDGGGIVLLSPLAGPARRLTPVGPASFPCWAPDGSRLAYVIQEPDLTNWVEIISVLTGETRRLALPGRTDRRFDLNWSRDGRFFAYVDALSRLSQVSQIRVLRVDDEKSLPLTNGRWSDWSPTWSSDGKSVYFVSNRGGAMDLWEQAVARDGTPVGDAKPITTGVGMLRAAFSPDGKKLAYSRGARLGNVLRVPIFSDRPATWEDARQLTFDQAWVEFVDVSPDGRRLALSSDRSGNFDIWTLPVEGGEMQQLTTDPTPDWAPAWSPAGREIAFYAYRSGNRDIWIVPATGGVAHQITRSEATDYLPHWSPDGRQIIFTSLQGGNQDLWVIPATGGEPKQVTDHPAVDLWGAWSPDGKWLAFASDRSGFRSLFRMPAAGGTAEQLTRGPAFYPLWSRDGKSIYFAGAGKGTGNIWQVTLGPRVERPVTHFTGKRGSLGQNALATDGKYLYFTWQEDLSDIWVMDVVRDR